MSISFHPADNDKLTYEEADRIASEFAHKFFWSKGYEAMWAVHTDTEHIHVHFIVSNCNLKDGKSFRRGMSELKEMSKFFGEQCRGRGLVHSVRDTFYNEERTRERKSFAECQMQKHDKLSFREGIKAYVRLAIKEHGILNTVIVWKNVGGYEMLAGHNRQMAGKLAGLTEIPAIVKTDLCICDRNQRDTEGICGASAVREGSGAGREV